METLVGWCEELDFYTKGDEKLLEGIKQKKDITWTIWMLTNYVVWRMDYRGAECANKKTLEVTAIIPMRHDGRWDRCGRNDKKGSNPGYMYLTLFLLW